MWKAEEERKSGGEECGKLWWGKEEETGSEVAEGGIYKTVAVEGDVRCERRVSSGHEMWQKISEKVDWQYQQQHPNASRAEGRGRVTRADSGSGAPIAVSESVSRK